MRKPIKVVPREDVFRMYWMITDFCNHHCHYCPKHLNLGFYATGEKPGFPSDDEIKMFLNKLETISKDRRIAVQFGGGEPTLHPMLPEIINTIKSFRDDNYVGIVTNGSRTGDWWEKVLPLNSVSISLHPEYTKTDRALKTAKIIRDSDTPLNFNLALDTVHWDRVQEMYYEFSEEFPGVVIPKILNYLDTPTRANREYTQEQWTWIRQTMKDNKFARTKNFPLSDLHFDDGSIENWSLVEWTANEWHQFKGWKCRAGYDGVNIRPSGEVLAGICDVQTLGRLDSFELLDEPLICPKDNCPCPADLLMEKWAVDTTL